MKKIFFGLLVVIFLISFLSASIGFEVQPQEIYNRGDLVKISIKIIPEPIFEEVVSVLLICNSDESEVYKEFLSLTEEKIKEIEVSLVSSLIGNSYGSCKFQIKLGNSLVATSNNFEISKSIKIDFLNWGGIFDPGFPASITGSAIKENGNPTNGIYELKVGELVFLGEIINGEINIIFDVPENFSAGEHRLNLTILEKKNGEILNYGNKLSFLIVRQVPTNIEISLNQKKIMPGEQLRGKIILHDQTGKTISGEEAYIAIKDASGRIIEKISSKTGEEFAYNTEKNDSPSIFQISVYSGEIINHGNFEIIENKEVESEIIENFLILTNVGNVDYNENFTLSIGMENISFPLFLKVGQTERYKLTAPDGDYEVSVKELKSSVFLSGNAIGVVKIGENYSLNFLNYAIWIIVLFILSFGTYLVFKKERKRKMFSRANKVINSKKVSIESIKISKNELLIPSKKIELSLSITGSKQTATIGCIFLKNYDILMSGEGGVNETLSRIYNLVEESKGFVYLNNSYIFFILAPHFTKTFKNQKEGLLISQKIKEILKEHNKKFKQKMDFGISLNSGEIILNPEKGKVKFMSLGTFMTLGKKLASFSDGEILISENLKTILGVEVKGSLMEFGGIKSYKFENISDKNVHSTFIKGFLARQEREKAKEKI
ncbi:hypothetical protein COU58_03175 [Candidatus Pacearchaeota archaeon CG10_big_fil_rev_8_21_14_0_10_32_42]|nr:MAG: hypothetical protein COU58_03175 [Candidatus Pacearchaeota archaeon CG10_big_fil_rev_8_21_14_0_10_32_42]